jgi:hypothetical protein
VRVQLIRSVQIDKDVDGSHQNFCEDENNDNPLEQFALHLVSKWAVAEISKYLHE